MNLSIDLFSIPNWHNFIPVMCVCVHSCTCLYSDACMWCGFVCGCCVETGSLQTQFPRYSKRNVPAATAIRVVNNPSHQLRQGPLSPQRKKKRPTQRQSQETVRCLQLKRGSHFLTWHSLRLQLAFRADGRLKLLQTNEISTGDVLKCQV